MAFLLLGFLFGCAGGQVRSTLGEDTRIPPGKIEGNQFIGIRYPFTFSVPSHWMVTTVFPDFMETLGYDRLMPADTEQTEAYAVQSRNKIEHSIRSYAGRSEGHVQPGKDPILATAGTESLKAELEEEHGKNVVTLEVGPTVPAFLKGVPYAARKHVSYTLGGVRREQGWVYGFAEPYQIFILYMILEKEGSNDREEINRIVDSFRMIPTPGVN